MENKPYKPLALLYFFFNSVLLPHGLLYTSLLAPFLYLGLNVQQQSRLLGVFMAVLLPFAAIHLYNGVVLFDYLRSSFMLFTVTVFCYTVYLFAQEQAQKFAWLFRFLILVNFALALLALLLYFTDYRNLLWHISNVSGSLRDFPRLKLFTYEASYYSLLMAPLFCYSFLKAFYAEKKVADFLLFLLVLVPLVLSFSLGVLGSIAFAMLMFFIKYEQLSAFRHKNIRTVLVAGLGLLLLLTLLLFVENPLLVRLGDIISGTDTSARGRTYEAFGLAYKIAAEKSLFFGVGLGQLKIVGRDILIQFYKLSPQVPLVSIPNAMAETLAIFGFAGVLLRLGAQIFLFVYTRVAANPFRLMLFCFAFLYQFTGSFISNTAEWVLWTLAFCNCLPAFKLAAIPARHHTLTVA